MWSAIVHFIEGLSPIASIIHILAVIPIVSTWWVLVVRRRAREKRQLRETMREAGSRPAVLIVSLLTADIENSVLHYIHERPELKKVIEGNRLFKVKRTDWLHSKDMPGLYRDLTDASSRVIGSGADVLHIFYGGPVVPGMLVGSVFGNRGQILMYYQSKGTKAEGEDEAKQVYECWGPMNYEISAGSISH